MVTPTVDSPKLEENSSDHQEIEWQFNVPDLRAVERWIMERKPDPKLTITADSTLDLVDVYFDTEDWRFYRAGYALRMRRQGERIQATLKALIRASKGAHNRREISQTLKDPSLGSLHHTLGQVAEWVNVLLGPNELKRIFELHTRRRTFNIRLDDIPAGEIALDETTFPTKSENEPNRIYRVEIETQDSSFSRLGDFVEEIRSGCNLEPANLSKFELGLKSKGLKPTGLPDLRPIAVDDSMSIDEVAFAVLRRNFYDFLTHEPGTRIGEDPEELHDMRVASRRLRTAMKLFADFLPADAEEMRRSFGWIADALGKVRDLDVQLEKVETWMERVTPADRDVLGALNQLLQDRRNAARKRMLRIFDSKRYERFLISFTEMLRHDPLQNSSEAKIPVLAVAPDLIGVCYKSVRKAMKRMDAQSPEQDIHKLRIRCKRLRYALEFMVDVYGKRAISLIKQVKKIQDILGLYTDSVVATQHLRDLAKLRRRLLPPETLFVMGLVAKRYESQTTKLHKDLPKAYRKIKKSWKPLERLMEKRSEFL